MAAPAAMLVAAMLVAVEPAAVEPAAVGPAVVEPVEVVPAAVVAVPAVVVPAADRPPALTIDEAGAHGAGLVASGYGERAQLDSEIQTLLSSEYSSRE